MSKLITFSITLITLSILFASCGSSLTITKRHYTKGYYISSNFKKQSVSSNKEEDLVQKEDDNAFSVVTNNNETSKDVTKFKDDFQTENSVVELKENNELPTSTKNNTFMKTSKEVVKTLKSPVEKIKDKITNKKMKSTPVSDGDGLSLLWIVIIVLLILWALGFISGNFGGLVHLLLVIALILLILWLLRII